jgi:predicted tellurium resistance membrane protein TerC
VLLIIGLAISIPLVIFGSTLMIKLMDRFPIIITFGACLIGWVGGETVANDVVLREFGQANHWFHFACAATGAIIVLAWGKLKSAQHHKIMDSE